MNWAWFFGTFIVAHMLGQFTGFSYGWDAQKAHRRDLEDYWAGRSPMPPQNYLQAYMNRRRLDRR